MTIKEFINWKVLKPLLLLLFITAIFAIGGILLGTYFNYITTGVWFL